MELDMELGLEKEVKGGRGSAGSRAARGCSGRSEGTRSRVAPGLGWAVVLEGVGEGGLSRPLVYFGLAGESGRGSPSVWGWGMCISWSVAAVS